MWYHNFGGFSTGAQLCSVINPERQSSVYGRWSCNSVVLGVYIKFLTLLDTGFFLENRFFFFIIFTENSSVII